ncbi:MAG: hypothetical protein ACLSVR_06025 [Christensenellales bacterium]
MKTPAQKVIYSLLTLILLLSIGSGVVATNGNRTELINPELDNELSEETLKIIPIEDTLDYALYEQADKLSKSFINQNTKKAIDDNYGGTYYDDGDFVFMFKDTSKVVASQAQSIIKNAGLRMKGCIYSYNELMETMDSISNKVVPKLNGFTCIGMDTPNNTVVVQYVEDDPTVIKQLCIEADIKLEMVAFKKISAPILPTSTMYAGKTSYNSTRGSTSSACVGVNGPGGAGFIIQGHDTLVGDSIKPSSSDSTVGSVYSRCQPMITGREADASYVLLNSGHNFSNILDGITSANVMVPGRTFDVYVDLPVYMRARHAYPFNSGKVTLENVHYSWPDRDGNTHNYQGAQANYSAQAGDSGGLVFVYTNLGPIWAGVQSGGGAGYLSVFARATDVVSSLNVSVN